MFLKIVEFLYLYIKNLKNKFFLNLDKYEVFKFFFMSEGVLYEIKIHGRRSKNSFIVKFKQNFVSNFLICCDELFNWLS